LPSPYTITFLSSIKRTITQERLTRYLDAAGQDLSKALELYECNVQLSEALYGLLHGLEVTVRNAAHHALTASYGTPTWYDTAPLTAYWQDQLDKVKAKPGVAGKPGKVVAELTFGFWIELLSKPHHNELWMSRRLRRAFPNTTHQRHAIHQRLKTVQLLRNRISHHERVLTTAQALYTGAGVISLPEILECVDWICRDTAEWIKTQFRYAEAERILRDVAAQRISL
jgi:hypothetical protein